MTDIPRIVFFGTPLFAVPSLERLITAGYDIAAVITAPDKKTGRKRALTPSPVKQAAAEHGLHILQPHSLKEESVYEEFAAMAPDLCIVVAYGKLIPRRLLDVPRLGFLNVHPSLLPKWRGASPIQTAILNGDEETGVTIMKLDEEMDHGPILTQHRIELDGTEYYPKLSDRLAAIGAELLADTVAKHLMDTIQPYEQDHDSATSCSMVTRTNARIDWGRPAIEAERMVRAYAGEPISWTKWRENVINIIRARAHRHQEPQTRPGTVLGFEDSVLVDTPDGTLELLELQPAGKRPMTAREFVNGHPELLGSRFE